MLTTMVLGCSGSSTVQEPEMPKRARETGITITFGMHQSGLPTTGIVQELAKDFQEETGIKIAFKISPDEEWRDLLKGQLEQGEAPDIFGIDADAVSLGSRVRPEENCLDLTNEEFTSRMDLDVLPAISYKNKVYGITFPGKKMYVYLYSKKIFKELNLEIPTNYEAFKGVCEAIKASGVTPIYECTQNGWHQVLPLFETGTLYQNHHKDLYNKLNNNEMNLDDVPELLEIVRQLKEFATLGYYGDDFLDKKYEGATKAFAKGEVAMVMAEPGWAYEVQTDFPEVKADEIGIFAMPWGDNQTIGVNPASNAYFINKNSKNAKAALKFFEFLARPENLQKRLEGQPGILEVCWPEIQSKYPEEYAEYINKMDKGTVLQAAVSYIDSQWMEIGEDLEEMYIGTITPEEVVKRSVERRNQQALEEGNEAWKHKQ